MKKRFIIGGFVAGCLVAIVLALAVQIGRNIIIERIETVAERTNRTITVGQIEVHLDGTIDIYDLWISEEGKKTQGALSIEHLHGSFSIPRLLKGSLKPDFAQASGVSMRVDIHQDGSTSLDSLIAEARRLIQRTSPADAPETSGVSILPQVIVDNLGVAVRAGNWKGVFRTPIVKLTPTQDGGATTQAEGTLEFGSETRTWAASGWLGASKPRKIGFQVVFDEPAPVPIPDVSMDLPPRLKTVDWNPDKGLTLRELTVLPTEENSKHLKIDRIFLSTEQSSGWPTASDINQVVMLGLSGGDGTHTVNAREIFCTLSPNLEHSVLRRVQQVVTQDIHIFKKDSSLRSISIREAHTRFQGVNLDAPLGGMKNILIQEPTADLVMTPPGDSTDLEGYLAAFNQTIDDLSEEAASEALPTSTTEPTTDAITNTLASILAPIDDVNIAVHRGSFRIHDPTTNDQWALFTGLDASWAPNTRPDENHFQLSARLIDGLENPSAIEVRGVLDPRAKLRSLDIESSSGTLAQFLPTISEKLRSAPNAEAFIDFHVEPTDSGELLFSGRIRVSGVGIDWWRIAHVPIENIEIDATFEDILYDPKTDVLQTACLSEEEKQNLSDDEGFYSTLKPKKRRICRSDGRKCKKARQCCSRRCGPDGEDGKACCTPKRTRVRIGKVEMATHFRIENLMDVPRIELGIRMPRHSCASALASIPPELIPRLKGMRTAGYVEFDLNMSIDMADSYSLKLDLEGDLNSCVVLSMGKHVRVGRLLDDSFVHVPVVKGEKLPVEVGPGTLSWTPYFQIPEYVRMAAVATEDLDFFKHEGFKLSLIKRAMKLDLDRGRYVYGGSTISQQLVKNLFLSREKTLARKLEEAIITWNMERMVSKQRILELYLNCIEYGPNIYGIRNAARHYFGKEPSHLTPLEGAFLMGLKPCPSCGYRQWKRKGVNKRWQKKLRFIMTRLMKRGWVSEEQFQLAVPFLPAFYYSSNGYIHPTEPQ